MHTPVDRLQILGAFTSVYLLEKPRITNHLEGERNYHIFYMLCKGPKPIRDSVGITKWQDYYICNQKGTVADVTTWNDVQEFTDCHVALCGRHTTVVVVAFHHTCRSAQERCSCVLCHRSKLGFSDQQRGEAYTMLAMCLNMGNLTFRPGKEGSEIPDHKLLARCAAEIQVDQQMLLDAVRIIVCPQSADPRPHCCLLPC